MKTFLFLLLFACIVFGLQKPHIKAVAKKSGSGILDGSASYDPDPMHHITKFEWSQYSGAQCVIVSPASPVTAVRFYVAGKYIFVLKVTSSDGLTDTAHTQINVIQR